MPASFAAQKASRARPSLNAVFGGGTAAPADEGPPLDEEPPPPPFEEAAAVEEAPKAKPTAASLFAPPAAAHEAAGAPSQEDEAAMAKEFEAKFGVSGAKLDKMMGRMGKKASKGKKSKGKKKGGMDAMLAKYGPPPGEEEEAPAEAQSMGDLASSLGDFDLDDLDALKVGSTKDAAPEGGLGGLLMPAVTWKPSWTLRSHTDAVRAVAWHPTQAMLVSGSEDGSVKYWDLSGKPPRSSAKKGPPDVEPVWTFRGHMAPVVATAFGADFIVSAATDGSVRVWDVPPPGTTPYDVYGDRVALRTRAVFAGHTDAVWSLSAHPSAPVVLSASADRTVKVWAVAGGEAAQTLSLTYGEHTPTCVRILPVDTTRALVTYSSGALVVFDLTSGKPVVEIDGTGAGGDPMALATDPESVAYAGYVGAAAVFHHSATAVTAHEDHHLRYWDLATGALLHAMVAHQDAVSAVAVAANDTHVVSGGHDSSLRIWDVSGGQYSCVQEVTAHRKKWDESIHSVAAHPLLGHLASSGADAVVKAYTKQ